MANQEQLEILKQGVDVWNKWREENPVADIDLVGVNLDEAYLRGVNLTGADLRDASLKSANLVRANFEPAFSVTKRRSAQSDAALIEANFSGANLSKAILSNACLNNVNFSNADLSGAILIETDFFQANLSAVSLAEAKFVRTNLSNANLKDANLKEAFFYGVIFGNIDLSETYNLEEAHHDAPSTIGLDTIRRSKGKISEKFLRGCGLSDVEIESAKLADPGLTNEDINKILYRIYDLRATQALQISPLFISYSHADSKFVDRIDHALTAKGVRFWRDIHDAKAGRLETQIDLAIRQNPTVLLVLSKNSLSSDWVEHEVRHARKLEKELGRDALCPIALDDSWKSSKWPERVMEQIMDYNILDFSGWEDKSTFEGKFARLLSGLDLFYKKSEK
ncbi:MAG: toll/interleukin-1 receptor domain-containing protein [Chloroflexota bacterium]